SRSLPPLFYSLRPPSPIPTLFPYTTLFRSLSSRISICSGVMGEAFGVFPCRSSRNCFTHRVIVERPTSIALAASATVYFWSTTRSEEHTSELQSRFDLVCRLLLEKTNDSRG